MYRDMGWAYVSSFSGVWHYFRRPWEPGETPKLYTDRESLVEHYKKIKRVMAAMLFANLVILFANFANIVSRLEASMRWGDYGAVARYLRNFVRSARIWDRQDEQEDQRDGRVAGTACSPF
ncbi:DUF2812 domain-containing protein [Cohnella rhizosphaerae]|uniref:DUF2812 domain-containing protein n=1 Tax=Cohnella rhizosphaerae TaxID=1457232 RepID=A0A9X4KRN3_9BACL|nr:DUF2812 domain-containing protein [Cohnella rhizosphaerae]MDG0809303.1 DUF2812 domain-containing protein [Cohnella rhizosphaerae]